MELVIWTLYYFAAMFILHIAVDVVSSASDLLKIKIGVMNGNKNLI